MGLPLQEPVEAVSTWPTIGEPEIVGRVVLAGPAAGDELASTPYPAAGLPDPSVKSFVERLRYCGSTFTLFA